ncbi:MAG: DUF262 domain-containing HNH endonuclease family protein [Mediterranea sp.]|jgi:hypothetical protein|nr:DUF262 domain-containing HNH endonuclease family protein [Mediterranea sp.]
MKGIQNTTTINFGTLLRSTTRYIVPKYQRDYSWDTEQWDDLWQDINQMLEDGTEEHYMGYLVLQAIGKGEQAAIIDGQQRFTTIIMIILAAIKSIKKLAEQGTDVESNLQRVESLMHTYIGNIDPITLDYDNFLVLNRNNNAYYRDYLVKLGELRRGRITATEKLMRGCFEWYEKVLDGKFATGEEYASFIWNVTNSLYFTVITVGDEMNAFRVFETLNARGVQLSSADLLKNYLFSLVDKVSSHHGAIDSLEEKWFKLINTLGTEKIPDFLRYYWNSQNKTVRSSNLFKVIRMSVKDAAGVHRLLEDLLQYCDVYTALNDPDSDYWEHDAKVMEDIALLRIFGLKQPYSLLMVGSRLLPKEVFKKLLKEVLVTSFRYSIICTLNPNDIEKAYNEVALSVVQNRTYDRTLLRKVYIDDAEFVSAFTIRSFEVNSRTTKLLRYILGELEHYLTGHPVSIVEESNTIEHILPQMPDEEDWDIAYEKVNRLSSRLGNLCLLEKRLNKEAGNKGYQTKLSIYAKSAFQTTQRIGEHYNEWNETTILSRQQQMALKAKGIWKID